MHLIRYCTYTQNVIAHFKTTLQTLNRRPKFKQKANNFDNYTTSKSIPKAFGTVPLFFIFPLRTFFKNKCEAFTSTVKKQIKQASNFIATSQVAHLVLSDTRLVLSLSKEANTSQNQKSHFFTHSQKE